MFRVLETSVSLGFRVVLTEPKNLPHLVPALRTDNSSAHVGFAAPKIKSQSRPKRYNPKSKSQNDTTNQSQQHAIPFEAKPNMKLLKPSSQTQLHNFILSYNVREFALRTQTLFTLAKGTPHCGPNIQKCPCL